LPTRSKARSAKRSKSYRLRSWLRNVVNRSRSARSGIFCLARGGSRRSHQVSRRVHVTSRLAAQATGSFNVEGGFTPPMAGRGAKTQRFRGVRPCGAHEYISRNDATMDDATRDDATVCAKAAGIQPILCDLASDETESELRLLCGSCILCGSARNTLPALNRPGRLRPMVL
jgi:hypothetical protein